MWPSSVFLLTFIFNILKLSYEYDSGVNYSKVTCGSVIKLLNNNYKARLHSHEIKYGSGSGQQSVTGTDVQEDINSHWVIKGPNGKHCTRGEPISCGDTIRLEHLITQKNLHSHLFSSPLSGNQEVSAFGDKGDGDSGDHWVVTCNGQYWDRKEDVRLKHVDTDAWLSISGHTYGRPIRNQLEVCAVNYPDSSSYWRIAEGVFIKPVNFPKIHQHTEL
ncbi:stromal cell-derived factor 2 [Centruroides vittatus]|uniref:stromal cell-derived factor 2 n=1 Tax=Centruroides vittatus TaxID=120091 RepID=UPI00350EF085